MRSLEYVEKEKYLKPRPSVLKVEGEGIKLEKEALYMEANNNVLALDGIWKLNGYDAKVPGSVHSAMYEAGVIPDPYKGLNDKYAQELSMQEWWYEKEFKYEGRKENVFLVFEGIADRCEIYLNDVFMCFHQGMFAPVEINVTEYINIGHNKVKVHLYPAIEFNRTVVFNCSYGWHYARIWPLGIWRSVKVIDRPKAWFDNPFITTRCHVNGTVELLLNLVGENLSGVVYGTVEPLNFEGDSFHFMYEVKGDGNKKLSFDVPNFRLWWPNGYGEQNLYSLKLSYVEDGKVVADTKTTFGIRTLEMKPFPSGPREDTYSRTVVVNGRSLFMKGAGWCTIDALMRFDCDSYYRILSRAKQQGVNFLRAWGGGLVETDEFYSLCDEFGICVYQEWPTCWDSQKTQPEEVLYETVVSQIKRIRNRPSLVLYGGGNEGHGAFSDEVLNGMGALTYEHDGTRLFYRQDGGESSKGMAHDHIHWSGDKPEHYLTMYANKMELNLHEYGLDSMMDIESVLKFASLEDIIEWPIDGRGVIAHHTATFNGEYGWSPTPHGHDVDTFQHYANMFVETSDLKSMVLGSQLAQALSKYPTIINSRIKWPDCSKVIYYKLNDVYPGASWSVVDWYGVPKIAHYLCQDAFQPLMACGFFDRYNTYDKDEKDLHIPVYVLDDNLVVKDRSYEVVVKAYDGNLDVIKKENYSCIGNGIVSHIGDFHLDGNECSSTPLIIVFTLIFDAKNTFRTYMYLNFDKSQGSLFCLPKSTLEWSCVDVENTSILREYERFNEYGACDRYIKVTNTGDKPCVSVHVLTDYHAELVISDNHFFLECGESKILKVNDIEKVKGFSCFNNVDVEYVKMFDKEVFLRGEAVSYDRILVSWDRVDEATGYAIFVNGKKKYGVKGGCNCTCLIDGLSENTDYEISIGVYKGLEVYMCKDEISVKTGYDTVKPFVRRAYFTRQDKVTLIFSKEVDLESDSLHAEGVREILVNGEHVEVVLDRLVPVSEGVAIIARNVHDKTCMKNELADNKIHVKPMKRNIGKYRYEEGSVFIKDSDYSIKECGVMAMRIKPYIVDGQYQVFFARGAKGGNHHFEFYISPGGELRMYSSKGDHYLGVNIKEYVGKWNDFTVLKDGMKTSVYFNRECVYKGVDTLDCEDGVYDICLGSLTDNTLTFKGEIEDCILYTGIPEMML